MLLWGLLVLQLSLLGVIMYGEFGFDRRGPLGTFNDWIRWILLYLYALGSGLVTAVIIREYHFIWIQLLPPLAILFYEMVQVHSSTGEWPSPFFVGELTEWLLYILREYRD